MAQVEDRTPWRARSTRGQRLRRGLVQHCPRCGAGGITTGFFDLADDCPSCGWHFEREEGYWLGAMVVLFAVVELLFGLFLLVGIVATWPDVPWTALLVGGLVLNAVVPLVAYRWSKTTWMGLHTLFVPAVLDADAASADGS